MRTVKWIKMATSYEVISYRFMMQSYTILVFMGWCLFR